MRQSRSTFSTCSSLIERVQAQDEDAWMRLSRLYGPVVYRWARLAGLQQQDAADIVQEVLRSVSSAVGRFQQRGEEGGFRGWIRTITRNKVHDHFRSAAKQAQAVGGSAAYQRWQSLADTNGDSSATEDENLTLELVHRALGLMQSDFEERTWTAFLRTAVDGQRAADIAEELNMTVGTVYQSKSRVLRRLREELDGLL